MRTILLLTLAAVGLAPPSTAHDPACPDERASQVDATVSYSGEARTCGIGFVIFGVGGGFFGETCYPLRIITPAHQECRGEPNPGTRCLPDGVLPVTARDCKCGGLVLPLLQIGIPTTCVCDPPYHAGTVEDFATVACD